jgi:hypothetical protein
LYGYSVAERSTEGFKEYSPETSRKLGGIVSTETAPLIAGGVTGLRASQMGSDWYNLQKIDYRAMKQEGVVSGVPDYLSFKGKKALTEADWYVREKVIENPRLQAYAKDPFGMANIEIRAALQEFGTPKITQTKQTEPILFESGASSTKAQPVKYSSIGTKYVGGRQVSGLRPEQSLRKSGYIPEIPKESKTRIGTRTDYRSQPKTDTSESTKQASGQILLLEEQLPQQIDRVPRQQVSQRQQYFDIRPEIVASTEFESLMKPQIQQEDERLKIESASLQESARKQQLEQVSEQMKRQKTKQEEKTKLVVTPVQKESAIIFVTSPTSEVISKSSQESTITPISSITSKVTTTPIQIPATTIIPIEMIKTTPVTKQVLKQKPVTEIVPISIPSWDSSGGVSGYHKTSTTKKTELLSWLPKPKSKPTPKSKISIDTEMSRIIKPSKRREWVSEQRKRTVRKPAKFIKKK